MVTRRKKILLLFIALYKDKLKKLEYKNFQLININKYDFTKIFLSFENNKLSLHR